MPASNAFTGFTSNGQNLSAGGNFNVDGTTDYQKFFDAYGHNFWTNSSKNKTIFFPILGWYRDINGLLYNVGNTGFYWSAVPNYTNAGCYLYFYWGYVDPQSNNVRAYGCAARPVSE